MMTLDTYALLLIFYLLVGVLQGVGNAFLAAQRAGFAMNNPKYLLCGGVGLVYACLGMGLFGRVPAVYVYLPAVRLWWAGARFGRQLYPVVDHFIASLVGGCMVVAMLLYHVVL